MDASGLLRNEALQPVMRELMRRLIDDPETAAFIMRLPPPRVAMMYHAALMRTSTPVPASGDAPLTAERVCASVLDAYALRARPAEANASRMRGLGADVCCRVRGDSLPLLEEALVAHEARLQHRVAGLALAGCDATVARPQRATADVSPTMP